MHSATEESGPGPGVYKTRVGRDIRTLAFVWDVTLLRLAAAAAQRSEVWESTHEAFEFRVSEDSDGAGRRVIRLGQEGCWGSRLGSD